MIKIDGASGVWGIVVLLVLLYIAYRMGANKGGA
jgi:hypothetical protein